MAVIKEICDRVAVMENGKIVEEGDVYDVFANPKQPITKNSCLQPHLLASLKSLKRSILI